MKTLLIVHKDSRVRTALEGGFRESKWTTQSAAGAGEAFWRFREQMNSVVMTGLKLADGTGLQVRDSVRNIAPLTPVVLLTSHEDGTELPTRCGGPFDYVLRPVSLEQIIASAESVLRDRSSSEAGAWIGTSAAANAAIERALLAAKIDADLLVQAESGTGKKMLARLVHQNSSRAKGPFISVNCIGFAKDLLERELFGVTAERLDHTRKGRFQLADGGTLLLDEVGELPLELQAKLLRVLQDRHIEMADGRSMPIDVRVIANTSRDLLQVVKEGKFRPDLYYQLKVVSLRLPPLRDRRCDIIPLAQHFLSKHGSDARRAIFSDQLLGQMVEYDWPGNVRELENVVRRLLAVSTGKVLGVELLDETECGDAGQFSSAAGVTIVPGPTNSLRDVERRVFETTLRAARGNRTRTAALLGVSVRTVRNKINQYGLKDRLV